MLYDSCSKNGIFLSFVKVFLYWFGLLLYVSGNSYGHVGMVSSPKHIFFLGKLEQAVNQYLVHILLLVTDINPF